jgi:hypothetical protein
MYLRTKDLNSMKLMGDVLCCQAGCSFREASDFLRPQGLQLRFFTNYGDICIASYAVMKLQGSQTEIPEEFIIGMETYHDRSLHKVSEYREGLILNTYVACEPLKHMLTREFPIDDIRNLSWPQLRDSFDSVVVIHRPGKNTILFTGTYTNLPVSEGLYMKRWIPMHYPMYSWWIGGPRVEFSDAHYFPVERDWTHSVFTLNFSGLVDVENGQMWIDASRINGALDVLSGANCILVRMSKSSQVSLDVSGPESCLYSLKNYCKSCEWHKGKYNVK